MHDEFTAINERDGDWFIAQCPEVPEANGQVARQMKQKAIWPCDPASPRRIAMKMY